MNYRGKPFDKLQLIMVVESYFLSALDRIEAALPPTIDHREYMERKSAIMEYICGCEQTVAMGIPVLYATLTGEGMGVADFKEYDEFERIVKGMLEYVEMGKNADQFKYSKRLHLMAVEFVDREFSDYLSSVSV